MRLLFKTIIFVVVIVIAALIALPFIVDPNDYKQEITEQVENATGRTLTINGDIGLSVFPWVALELGQLSLSNATGFKAKAFADVNEAEIRIKLLPLLSKKLELDTIILDGLTLNLAKNKVGKTNWDDLTGDTKSTDTSSKTEKDDKTTSDQVNASPLAGLTIAGVKLTNANIVWDDESKGEKFQLNNFNLTTDPIEKGKPTAVDVAFDVLSEKPRAEAHIELTTKLAVNMDKQQYSLSDLKFTTEAKASDFAFDELEVKLSSNLNADMVKHLITADGIELIVNASGASLPAGKMSLKLTTDASANLQKQTATLSKLALSVQDLLINGEVSASKILSASPNLEGMINVDAFNLRQLAKNMAIELPIMSDDSTLELVQLETEFSASSKHFNAEKLALMLDQSKLNGQFAINNFANPAYSFKLNLDEIDADRYLPPATEAEESKTISTKTNSPAAPNSTTSTDTLPIEPLRTINAKGTIDIGKLKISGTNSQKIHIELNANKGLINLSPMSANLYQGQYKGNVSLDARGKTLKLAINENLTGVQVGPLLKDLSGDDKMSGTANAQVKLTGNGATVDGIKKTLSGSGKFSFMDGAVKGVNIAESIRKAKAALKGETLEPSSAPLQTDFASLTGSFIATNGIISNQDLSALSPLLRIKGAGKIDLPKEGIDYGLKVAIVSTSKGQAGKDLADLNGITIPVKITGTFAQPKPTVDLASILKEKATAEAKAKIADKLQDKLGGDLGGLLGGALDSKEAPTEQQNSTESAPTKSAEDEAKEALKSKLKSFF